MGMTIKNGGSEPLSDKLQDENHQRNQKQNVDVRTQYVEPDKAQQPQHQQNNEDCPEHLYLSPCKCELLTSVWYGALDSA